MEARDAEDVKWHAFSYHLQLQVIATYSRLLALLSQPSNAFVSIRKALGHWCEAFQSQQSVCLFTLPGRSQKNAGSDKSFRTR